MYLINKQKLYCCLLVILAVLFGCENGTPNAKGTGQSDFQDTDLGNLQQVISRYQHASAEDIKTAETFLHIAERSAKMKKWAPAYKAYAESAIRRPVPKSLIGMANSLIKMIRQGKDMATQISKKCTDFRQAISYLNVALLFNEKINGSLAQQTITDSENLIKCVETYLQNQQSDRCLPLKEVLKTYEK